MKYLYDSLLREQIKAIVPVVAVFEALRKTGDRFIAETHDLLGTVQPLGLAGLSPNCVAPARAGYRFRSGR